MDKVFRARRGHSLRAPSMAALSRSRDFAKYTNCAKLPLAQVAAKVSIPPFVPKCAKAAFVTNGLDRTNSDRASEILSMRSTTSVSKQNEKILRPTANHHVYCNNRGTTLQTYYCCTSVLRGDGEIKKSMGRQNSMYRVWGRRLQDIPAPILPPPPLQIRPQYPCSYEKCRIEGSGAHTCYL